MAETFITVEAANSMLRSMVDQQINAFGVQLRAIEALNAETRELITQTRDGVGARRCGNKGQHVRKRPAHTICRFRYYRSCLCLFRSLYSLEHSTAT